MGRRKGLQNRTIFVNDNLSVLRGLGAESIDLIYLDPPFNSQHNYAAPIGSKAEGAGFRDIWTLKDVDEIWWGEIEVKNRKLHTVLQTAGEVHGGSTKSYLIYMARRLMEMHRILKSDGCMYLHCDSTMSHYLKLVLDSLFGPKNYRNEIVWKRFSSHNDGKRYGRVSDTIFFYTKSDRYTWNQQYAPYSEEYVKREFRCRDARGPYMHKALTAEGLSGGGYEYTYMGHHRIWKRSKESMLRLEKEGRIHLPSKRNGVPRYKIYLDEAKGIPAQNIWSDIPNVSGAEDLHYPTQKPLALLARIIRASSNAGDWVLDPFCGCATACHAAEELDRNWVGIDVSEKAYDLVRHRLQAAAGLTRFTKGAGEVIKRSDIPVLQARRSKDIATTLYGRQSGNCNGCWTHFSHRRHLTLDHIIPLSKGGQDDDGNLQLLCQSCNSKKGNRLDMYELIAKLKSEGLRSANCLG